MANSKLGKVNLKDLAKGAIVAGGTVVLSSCATSIQSGQMPDGPQIVVSAKLGLFALVAYLFKNLFTNSEDKILTAEPDKLC